MKRLLLFFVFLFVSAISSFATHIVGGEISIEYLSGTSYRFTLNVYRDLASTVTIAATQKLTIHRFSDNSLVESFDLTRISITPVVYTFPECAGVAGAPETEKYVYQATRNLDPNVYNEDEGYYATVQNYARNGTIDNLVAPGSTGQTFYMEFPKESLKNSSPFLLPPLSDYACINQPFTFDFGVTDPDGDDLVYSLIDPLDAPSSSVGGQNVSAAGPYAPVTFSGSFNVNNMVPGVPPLTISAEGILSVNPNQVGLFVFAVAIDEYRNGVKIGQIRREFQLRVLDCPAVDAPETEVSVNGSVYIENDILTFDYKDNNKCADIEINDPQADSDGQVIIKARNWDGSGITFNNPNWTGNNDFVEICFPDCPLPNEEPYIFDLIVSDNSCAVPLRDTTRMRVLIEYPNDIPVLAATLTFNTATKVYDADVFIDDILSFDVIANNAAPNEEIEILDVLGIGFNPATKGMNFNPISGLPVLNTTFTWTPSCNDITLEKDTAHYQIKFISKYSVECFDSLRDTITVDIVVRKPESPNPTLTNIGLNHDIANDIWYDTLAMHEFVNFSVTTTDADAHDDLSMELIPNGFDMTTLGMTFPMVTGSTSITSQFNWDTHCNPEVLTPNDTTAYNFNLFTITYDYCDRIIQRDTAQIRIVMLPEPNTDPITSSSLNYDPVEDFYWDTVAVNDLVNFTIDFTDADDDSLTFVFEGLDEQDGVPYDFQTDLGATFTLVSGTGFINTTFNWQTDCHNIDINTATMAIDTTAYFFRAYLADYGICDTARYKDTIDLRIVLIPAANNPPILSSTIAYDAVNELFFDSLEINNLENFTMTLTDPDGDSVKMSMDIDGFDMATLGATFPLTSGDITIDADFNWDLLCEHLIPVEDADTTDYIFKVFTSDFDLCGNPKAVDTVEVRITLLPNINTQPIVSSSLNYDAITDVYFDSMEINNLFAFTFDLFDADDDSLTIDFFPDAFLMTDLGATFSPTSGRTTINAQFDWQTFCEDLIPVEDADTTEYFFSAIITDYDLCANVRSIDTAHIKLVLLPNINTEPVITSSLNYDAVSDIYFDSLEINNHFNFTFDLFDADDDSLTIDFFGQGFDMTSAGATFTPTSGRTTINSEFDWDIFCQDLIPVNEADTTEYIFKAIITDYDLCDNIRNIDTATVKLVLLPNINTEPIASASIVFDAPVDIYRDTVVMTDAISFDFELTDLDGDSMTFEVLGRGFDMTSAGMTFTPNSGWAIISAQFNWQTLCQHATVDRDSLYIIDAVIKDYDLCGNVRSRDTTEFHILVVPPNENILPIHTSSLVYDIGNDIYSDTVVITETTSFTFDITDGNNDPITLELQGRGFDLATEGMTFAPNSGTGVINATFDWQTLCRHAEAEQDSLFIFDAIIKDYDICGRVRSIDTTQFNILVVPPNVNILPIHSSSLVYDALNDIYRESVVITEATTFTFGITDGNNDPITFELEGQGFNLASEGMTFTPNSGTGVISATFDWQTLCPHLVNDTETLYKINGIIKDYDICGNVRSTDTTEFHILVQPPAVGSEGNLSSDSLNYDAVNGIFFDTLNVLEAIRFDLKAADPDGELIILSLEGEGFTLAGIGATFQTVTNPDNSIDGDFNWQTTCNTLNPLTDTTTYIFNAIIEDFDVCGGSNFKDTTEIHLTILPRINPAPVVDTAGVSDLVYDAVRELYTVSVYFGDTLEFDMMGDDPDGDIITLSAQGINFDMTNLEMEFQPIRDLPRVESHFKWITGCNIYDKANYLQPYIVEFQIADEGNCAADSVNKKRVEITLLEVPNDIPVIYTEEVPINANSSCYEMRVVVGDTLKFDVLATDLNQDDVTISGSVLDFTFAELGMSFTSVTGKPASLPLSSEFVWATNFDILEDYQDSITYELTFYADDKNCEIVEMCVKITLVNCQTPKLAGLPALSNLCSAGDTLGREIPANDAWTYRWTSDVGIVGDSTQRLLFVQKAGIYTINVQSIADHCVYQSRTIVSTDDLFLAPKDTIICKSEAPAHLIARDLAHPSNFIFEWRNLLDTSVVVQSDTTGLLQVDSSGIYLVKMINPNGNCYLIDTVEAKINKNPSFDITGYENPVCKDPVPLRIENTNITGFEVEWSVQAADSTGYFEGATDNLNVTVLKSGLYIATLTDTATNCQTSKSIEIIINDNPEINLDASLKDTLICQDMDFVVDAFDASHPIDATYQWKKLSDNSVVSDSSKLVIPFGNFDKTSYEITVTTSSSSCQSKDTINVTFVRQAVAKITTNKTGICLGEEIILQASGGDSYLWSNGDTTKTLTISPEQVGIYTYILEAKYQNSCASSFDTVQIDVTTVPYVNIETTLGVCQEDTTAFLDARHSSHPFNSKYKWYRLGDTTTISDSSRIELKIDNFLNRGFDVLSPFDLVVKVSNSQNGCPATDTVRVEFGKAPIAAIDSVFKSEICLGESITLRATGGDTLVWNTGDSTAVVNITPDQIGYHRFIVFALNPLTCPATSDTIFVKVNPLPVIDLHQLDSIVICYGDTLQLTPTGGNSGKYVWEHLPSPADTVFVSPKVNTTYYVFGTDSNGCQSSDSLKVMVRPTIDLPEKMQACAGKSLEIGAESIVSATYLWTPGAFTTPTIKVKANGTYSVQVTTAECVYTQSVEVLFAEYPKLESTNDTTFCFEFGADEGFTDGKTHFIGTKISNFDTAANYDYVWLDTAGFILSGTDSLEVSEAGVYVVQVFDKNLKNACPVSDTVRVEALCEPRIYIPTGFSPNGDDLNDRFTIFGKHIQNFKMEVHDRWGALIYVLERPDFEDIKAEEFWDGTLKGELLPNGQYIWSIQYNNAFDGSAATVNLNGQVNIVR